MNKAFYEKKHTALLIVDPYNDFMSEGGKLYAATKPTADSVGYYENMRKLIPAVRWRLCYDFIMKWSFISAYFIPKLLWINN
jgi:hypothetical protein